MTKPVHLSDADLEALGITPAEVTDAVERAVTAKTEGRLWAAPKAALIPGDGRYTMATLSTGDSPAVTVVKAVTSNPASVEKGLPAINGAILVMDSQTGVLLATLEAGWVTAIRTAAISAAAARKMANPQSKSVAFIGTGVQARIHLDTFAAEYPLTEMRVVGRGRANIETLLDKGRAMGLSARECATPQEAIAGADMVVTSISLIPGMTPYLDGGWLGPGSFAAIVDLGIPWIPDTMHGIDTRAIDDHEQEVDAQPPLMPRGIAQHDLAQLVAGPHLYDPGKSAAFAFRGMAIGDYAAAALVAQKVLGL